MFMDLKDKLMLYILVYVELMIVYTIMHNGSTWN